MMKKILLLTLILFINISFSCGPEYQRMLLENRIDTLEQAPVGMFAEKIKALTQGLSVPNLPIGKKNDTGWIDYEQQRIAIEEQLLTANQMQLLSEARNAASLNEAMEILKNEKGAFVDYTLAKFYYRNVTFPNDNLDDHELGILLSHTYENVAKPEVGIDNEPWRLWGLFMLGKSQIYSAQCEQSVQTFAQVQALVEKGASDPLHLAADSLGWQARCYDDLGQYDKAVTNFLTLHKMGHPTAERWLLDYASDLLQKPSYFHIEKTGETIKVPNDRIKPAVKQPLTKRLLVIYAYTYLSGDSEIGELFKADLHDVPEVDQLAAYAYRSGRYESAMKFAKQSDSDLAKLIQAKLLIRQGQYPKASKIYAEIVDNIRQQFNSFEQLSADSCAAIAENTVFTLNQGHISEAFDTLVNYTGGEYWQDVSYIAEFLLTTGELIKKVDAIVSKPSIYKKPKVEDEWVDAIFSSVNKNGQYVSGIQPKYQQALSNLLARRLLREHKFRKAKDYFIQDVLKQDLSKLTKLYQASRLVANPKDKAQKTFAYAKFVRGNGWKLFGYEGYPDWLMFEMQYEGLGEPLPSKERIDHVLINDKEISLLIKHNAYQLKRFSHRYLASQIARDAAELLPVSDKNYEKYLCFAAKWVINTDAKLGNDIYKYFIKNAKPKHSVKYFGGKCDN